MLYKAKDLKNYKMGATDGEIGKVKEFYFDDRFWTVRYLVADTGNWLVGRQVLISPYALETIDNSEKIINTSLSRQQIEDSPSIEQDKPVSRQFETAYYGYYGWPGYWYGPYAWGGFYYPPRPVRGRYEPNPPRDREWDPNLRSSNEVTGYNIQAADGDIGHVDDFLIDDETWAVRYLVIDTMNWWPGKEVLVAPRWIDRISWDERKVFVNLDRDAIKQAPEYDRERMVTRDYEEKLHRYYSREGYWAGESLEKVRQG